MTCVWPDCWSQYHQNRLAEDIIFDGLYDAGLIEGPKNCIYPARCSMDCE